MVLKLDIKHKPEIQTLFLKVFSKPPWNDQWDSADQLSTYMDELIGQSNALCLGYYYENQLIGISLGYVFHWWEGTEYFVKELCIDADFQGQGHGKRFIEAIETYLKSSSIEAVWLMTERSTPAFSFYKNNGFKELKNNVVFAKGVE